jgi:hypothetical protein
LADTPAPSWEPQPQPAFFAASPVKVAVMSLCTLGLYQFYWFYMHWRQVRARTQESISPFWRAFFAVFWCYQLFHRIRTHNPTSPAASLAAGPLAVAWIVPHLVWNLPNPYGLLGFLSIFALLPVQAAANAVNMELAPTHVPNSRFTAWNWAGVVLGGPLLLLALLGSLLSPQ